MIVLNEHLHKTISSILETVSAVDAFLNEHKELSADHLQQVSYCCAELALLSLTAHDALDDDGTAAERMIKHELASAFKQIGMHSLNIQEWEHPENIRAYISTISKHCRFIAKTLDIPFAEPKQHIHVPDLSLVPAVKELYEETMSIIAIHRSGENQSAKIKGEIQALREILTALVLERDYLRNVVCKELEADYMENLGSLEAEIYHAECEARYLKRVMEMMQAAANRREEPDQELINEELKGQYEEYKKVYSEFVKRVQEASDFKASRKKKTESEKSSSSAAGSGSSEKDKECESEEQRIKKLYRKIVKAMHPDIHPNQSEETKELFKKAILAYEAGDLRTLIEIAGTIDGKNSSTSENRIEELLREKAHILTLIRTIKAEIHLIKTSYPYTKKELLEDPESLAQEKERLENRLERAQQMVEIYKKRIAEM